MYKKILVPLDGSIISESALANAVLIANGCHVGELVIINIIEPYKDLGHWVSDDVARRMQQEAARVARNYLDQIVERLNNEGVVAEAVIAEGDPGEAVLEYAIKSGADLIVMGTHGRAGISRLIFGSLAAFIINHSPIPVLLVPPTAQVLKNN